MINIKIARIRKGITQKELGEKIGVISKTVSKYELGEITPSVPILKNIADVLEVTTDYLLERE